MVTEKKRIFKIKEDGFYGELFESEKQLFPNKIIITCAGESSYEVSKKCAQELTEYGINVLVLSVYCIPDGPTMFSQIPIEYIKNATIYLNSIGYDKVGVWGISMNSIYCLLAACYYPELISLAIAASCNYFVVPGMDKKKHKVMNESAFTFEGKDIPYEPYTVEMGKFKNFWELIKHQEPNYSYLYEPLMGKVQEEHIIPVEKMKARVVVFSGKLDTMWPSYRSGQYLIQRLKEKNYSYPYEHIVCEYGGHLMFPLPTKFDKFMKVNRRYPKEAEQYRKEHLDKLLEIFNTW